MAANPYIDPTEIEAARLGLPERIFAQEFSSAISETTPAASFVARWTFPMAAAQDGMIGGHEYTFGVDGAAPTTLPPLPC